TTANCRRRGGRRPVVAELPSTLRQRRAAGRKPAVWDLSPKRKRGMVRILPRLRFGLRTRVPLLQSCLHACDNDGTSQFPLDRTDVQIALDTPVALWIIGIV